MHTGCVVHCSRRWWRRCEPCKAARLSARKSMLWSRSSCSTAALSGGRTCCQPCRWGGAAGPINCCKRRFITTMLRFRGALHCSSATYIYDGLTPLLTVYIRVGGCRCGVSSISCEHSSMYRVSFVQQYGRKGWSSDLSSNCKADRGQPQVRYLELVYPSKSPAI